MLVSGVHLFIKKKSKILLLRRFNAQWENGKYSTIAGHLDGHESVIDAAVREAKEEAGITIEPKDLEVVHVMHRRYNPKSKSYREFVLFFLTVKKWKGEPAITEPDKSDDMRWFDIDKLPDNLVPYMKAGISSWRKGLAFSEFIDPYPY
jgi:8-oxo-dGTP pyrophosphatase MutT (NUDIX family)